MKTIRQKAIASSAGIFIALLLLFFDGLRLPGLDTKADSYFQDAITKGGVTYATCRVINGSISVIKESSLHLEPAGVGVSLALGQALDPVDDMIERLSNILVAAITSLGVQKITYEMSISLAPPVLAFFLLALSTLLWFKNEKIKSYQNLTMRLGLFIVIARFCLPISSIANEHIHENFFDQQIIEAKKELAAGTSQLDEFTEFTLPEVDGIVNTIENSTSFLKQKSIALNNSLTEFAGNMGEITENLLRLSFLYVGIVLIEVIVLPLLVFFFLVKLVNTIFQ